MSIKDLELYYEKNLYIGHLNLLTKNPIEIVWTIVIKKIAGKLLKKTNILIKELYTIWKEFDDEIIIKTWMIIDYRMNGCIEAKGFLMDYYLFLY